MATQDIDKAKQTYSAFMNALKWAVPTIAIITFIIIMMIAE